MFEPNDPVRVLIVEDNPVNQKVVTRLLARLGCRVDVASDGVEAVAVAPQGYDLIFMDCSMPRMDGFEATRRIRAYGGAIGLTPVVAVTAHATPEDRARCLAVGMNDWLPKPVTPEDLGGALTRFTDWKPAPSLPLEGVLDERVVAELRALGGADDPQFLSDLVDEFRRSAGEALAQARVLHACGELDDARRSMNRLRSASATVGAVRLGEVCGRFDRASDDALRTMGGSLIDLASSQMELSLAALGHASAVAA